MSNRKERTGHTSSPKNFLVPYILLLLKGVPVHGYELMQRLTSCGFQTIDPGNIYRMLRQLEKEELVNSEWDTSSTGPAKRLYSVTEAGEKYLDRYANQLENYQSLLNQFFAMYSSMLDLYMPPYRKKGERTGINIEQENLVKKKEEEKS